MLHQEWIARRKPRMKFVNKTRWRTDHLRAIVARVVKMLPCPHRCTKLIFTHARQQRWATGMCHGKSQCEVRVPTKYDVLPPEVKLDLATVIAHELYHTTGPGGRADELWMRHKSTLYGRPQTDEGKAKQKEIYAWIAGMPLEKQPAAAPKQKRDHLAHYGSLLARWERRAKTAKTKIAKYRARVKYHAGKTTMAAMPSQPQ